MKYIRFNILVYILGALFFTSCSDYLTETNPNSQSSDNYWRNLKETRTTLNGAYSVFLNHYVTGLVEEASRADYGWPGYGRPVASTKDMDVSWYNQTYNNSTGFVGQKWNACYEGILRANQVIEGLKGLGANYGGNEEEWTQQMAEARFIRGIMHFWLYNTYNKGSIIIRDAVPKNHDEITKGVSPAPEVLAFFRKDLDYAYKNLLPKNEENTLGRATSGAAGMALGMSYLYNKEYDSASKIFDDLINNGKYGYALADPKDMWSKTGEFNVESIFEVVYSLNHKPEMTQWNEQSLSNRYAALTSSYSLPPAWLLYTISNEKMDVKDNRNYYIDNHGTRRLRNVSLRCSASVTVVNDEQTPYYMTDNATNNGQFTYNGWGFGANKKYRNWDTRSGGESGAKGENLDAWKTGKNVTIMRFSEVLLMQAECKIHSGDISAALSLINKIRARWGLELIGPAVDNSHTYDGVNYDAKSLMDRLMYIEKPLELYFEGNESRWIDLRRWGVIGKRFKDLSQKVYYAIDYNYTKVSDDGKEVPAKKPFSKLVAYKPTSGQYKIVDYEYKNPALNYNHTTNDWLPIPQGEINKNPNIFK